MHLSELCWDQIGPTLNHFGTVLGQHCNSFKRFQDHFGAMLEPCWNHLGTVVGSLGSHFDIIWGAMFLTFCLQVWHRVGTIIGHVCYDFGSKKCVLFRIVLEYVFDCSKQFRYLPVSIAFAGTTLGPISVDFE